MRLIISIVITIIVCSCGRDIVPEEVGTYTYRSKDQMIVKTPFPWDASRHSVERIIMEIAYAGRGQPPDNNFTAEDFHITYLCSIKADSTYSSFDQRGKWFKDEYGDIYFDPLILVDKGVINYSYPKEAVNYDSYPEIGKPWRYKNFSDTTVWYPGFKASNFNVSYFGDEELYPASYDLVKMNESAEAICWNAFKNIPEHVALQRKYDNPDSALCTLRVSYNLPDLKPVESVEVNGINLPFLKYECNGKTSFFRFRDWRRLRDEKGVKHPPYWYQASVPENVTDFIMPDKQDALFKCSDGIAIWIHCMDDTLALNGKTFVNDMELNQKYMKAYFPDSINKTVIPLQQLLLGDRKNSLLIFSQRGFIMANGIPTNQLQYITVLFQTGFVTTPIDAVRWLNSTYLTFFGSLYLIDSESDSKRKQVLNGEVPEYFYLHFLSNDEYMDPELISIPEGTSNEFYNKMQYDF